MYQIIQDRARIKAPEHILYFDAGIPSRYWVKLPQPLFAQFSFNGVVHTHQMQYDLFTRWYRTPNLSDASSPLRFLFFSKPDNNAIALMFAFLRSCVLNGYSCAAVPSSKIWLLNKANKNPKIIALYGLCPEMPFDQVNQIRDLFHTGSHLFLTFAGDLNEYLKLFKFFADFYFNVHGFAVVRT